MCVFKYTSFVYILEKEHKKTNSLLECKEDLNYITLLQEYVHTHLQVAVKHQQTSKYTNKSSEEEDISYIDIYT